MAACWASRRLEPGTMAGPAEALVNKAGSALAPLEQFFGLAHALEDLLGRPVDLVEPSAIKNPFIRAAINRSREVLYGA